VTFKIERYNLLFIKGFLIIFVYVHVYESLCSPSMHKQLFASMIA